MQIGWCPILSDNAEGKRETDGNSRPAAFLLKYRAFGTLANRPKQGAESKITASAMSTPTRQH